MNNIIPHDPVTGEVLDREETTSGVALPAVIGNQALAVSLAMAEVDQQITTAHAYPRSVAKVVRAIMELATLDEETAKECIYALPRGGKPIKGASIRFAEIVQSQWGNCRVGARVTHVDRIEGYIEAEGVFHDLETNSASTSRVRRRAKDKGGRILNEDMLIVTGNAASSIAKRNAILQGVPRAVWRAAYAQVERVLVGDVKTLVVRRAEAMKAFAAFGVKPEQIFEALDLGGMDDIGLDQMVTLIGMHSALKNQESTVEEMFPAKKPGGEVDKSSVTGRMAALAENGKPKDGAKEKPVKEKAAAKKKDEKQESQDAGASKPASSEGGAAEQQSSPSADGAASQSDDDPQASSGTGEPSSTGEASADDQPSETSRSADAITPKQEAYAAGRKARADGLTKKDCPKETRNDDDLFEAWLEGFDESPEDGE